MVTLSEDQYRQHDEGNDGYCTGCDDIIDGGGVEPDAEGYECPRCGENTMMGVAEALLSGHIDIGEEESNASE